MFRYWSAGQASTPPVADDLTLSSVPNESGRLGPGDPGRRVAVRVSVARWNSIRESATSPANGAGTTPRSELVARKSWFRTAIWLSICACEMFCAAVFQTTCTTTGIRAIPAKRCWRRRIAWSRSPVRTGPRRTPPRWTAAAGGHPSPRIAAATVCSTSRSMPPSRPGSRTGHPGPDPPPVIAVPTAAGHRRPGDPPLSSPAIRCAAARPAGIPSRHLSPGPGRTFRSPVGLPRHFSPLQRGRKSRTEPPGVNAQHRVPDRNVQIPQTPHRPKPGLPSSPTEQAAPKTLLASTCSRPHRCASP